MNKAENQQIKSEVRLDADVFQFLESVSANSENKNIDNYLNELLREKLNEEKAKSAKYEELRSKLLNDRGFLQELKEKLAA
jgi:hypothetical protein